MTGKYNATYGLSEALGAMRRSGDGRQLLKGRLAAAFGCRHAILFKTARCALYALLRTLGDSGKAVAPAYNCIVVPEAIERAGWKPVFADIAAADVNMTPETLAGNLPEDTRAVLLTHQFGLPCAIEPIMKLCRQRGVFVIEDAAPALGARYGGRPVGQFGDAALISFGLTKVAGVGRLGVLLTNDDGTAGKVRALCEAFAGPLQGSADMLAACAWWAGTRPGVYGAIRRLRAVLRADDLYEEVAPSAHAPGYGLRTCSAYVARLAERGMASLNANVQARRRLARIYAEELSGTPGIEMPRVPEGAEPAWLQFPIFVADKEACYRFLLRNGVDLSWTFRYSCGVSYGVRHAPNAEHAARTLLGLPTYPALPPSQARRISGLLRTFATESAASLGSRHPQAK